MSDSRLGSLGMRSLREAAFGDGGVLSVIVPVYNEAGTVAEALRRVVSVAEVREIVVVDDGSGDGTAEILSAEFGVRSAEWKAESTPGGHPHRDRHPHPRPLPHRGGGESILLLRHERNLGKGAAVRTGLAVAR